MAEAPDRNFALELTRVTEAAAIAAARFQGRGDKHAVDHAAVEAMRLILSTIQIDGTIVIGEGEKDNAPWLFNGEQVGAGNGPRVDVAVDPVDGTRLTAEGLSGALAVIAVSERGSMYAPGKLVYMEKLAVGPEAAGTIDIEAPLEYNLQQVAKARNKEVADLTVIMLNRPRNQRYVNEVRVAGARIQLIPDGDISAAIATAMPESGIDLLVGIGGSPEAVIAAAALRCLEGEVQCRLWPRDETEVQAAAVAGLDLRKVLRTSDLCGSENIFFAATGVTDGELLGGVKFTGKRAETSSIVMRSKTGAIRTINTNHNMDKIRQLSPLEIE